METTLYFLGIERWSIMVLRKGSLQNDMYTIPFYFLKYLLGIRYFNNHLNIEIQVFIPCFPGFEDIWYGQHPPNVTNISLTVISFHAWIGTHTSDKYWFQIQSTSSLDSRCSSFLISLLALGNPKCGTWNF